MNNNINIEHFNEWVEGSKVDPAIVELNVVSLNNPEEIKTSLNYKPRSKYKGDPGWWCSGVDPIGGDRREWGQFKPNTPLPAPGKAKPKKYVSPSGEPTEPIFLEMPDPNYWAEIIKDIDRAIHITEGAKKAGSALSIGIPTIALTGVWNGQDRKTALKPLLRPLCVPGRSVYLDFDSDMLINPQVKNALVNLGGLLIDAGCAVFVIQLPADAKGVDDFIVKYGGEAYQDLVNQAIPFQDWRDDDPTNYDKFDKVEARLDEIFLIEDPTQREWDLHRFAKNEAQMPLKLLLNLYDQRKFGDSTVSKYGLKDFLEQGSAKPEWLIAGVLPGRATSMLYAAPGTGKTLLAYDWAKAIATGSHWCGLPTRQGKVMIIQTDETSTEMRARLYEAGWDQGILDDQVMIIDRWQFNQMLELKQMIDEFQPQFLIIDSYTSCNRYANAEEKDTSYGNNVYALRDLANRLDIGIVVIHHTNKQGGIRGTSALSANVSRVMRLAEFDKKDGRDVTERYLAIEKCRLAGTGKYLLNFDPEGNRWEYVGYYEPDEDLSLNGQRPELPLITRIFDLLKANPRHPYQAATVAMAKSVSRNGLNPAENSVKRSLNQLTKSGLIHAESEFREGISANGKPYKVKVTYYSYIDDETADPTVGHVPPEDEQIDPEQPAPVVSDDVAKAVTALQEINTAGGATRPSGVLPVDQETITALVHNLDICLEDNNDQWFGTICSKRVSPGFNLVGAEQYQGLATSDELLEIALDDFRSRAERRKLAELMQSALGKGFDCDRPGLNKLLA